MGRIISSLGNNVAIVTGAGQGIGFEICCRLAAGGARVLLNDVSEAAALRAVKLIQNQGGICEPLVGDASDPLLIEAMVGRAVERFGRVDIAVANAGTTAFNAFLEVEPPELRKMLDLNLQGSIFLAQKAAKQMIQQGSGGRILFMSSVTGHQAHENLICYGMTKAALQMLAKGLVVELAPHGITTNAISPGAVITERTSALDPEYEAKWQRATSTGRVCTPADIAAAALFLASPEAAQITGQTLVIDGGWTCTSPTPSFDKE